MSNDKSERRLASRRWQAALGVIPAWWLCACATPATEPPAIDQEDPAISEHSAPLLHGEIEPKAGCTHIRFCTTPGTPNWITCDTNDQSCTSTARFNECRSDASFVCGRLTPMIFDPPIPCPISGISPCEGELGSIGFP